MAKKRKVSPIENDIDRLPGHMRRHIENLGLSSVEEYKHWCRQYTFSCGLNKTSLQRRKEINALTTIQISVIMTDEKKDAT